MGGGADKQIIGAIALADIIRAESHKAIRRLKAMGIKSIMLTGDAAAVARWVAAELGLDDYFADVLPHQKAAKIEAVKRRGLTVAMVGDGVNDAPALAPRRRGRKSRASPHQFSSITDKMSPAGRSFQCGAISRWPKRRTARDRKFWKWS